MDWKEKRKLMDNALKEQFVPKLKQVGFKGSYPQFRRFNNKSIDIIGIQFSQWGAQFYLEIAKAPSDGITLLDGKHFAPKTVKHYHTGNRFRIGDLPFDYDNEDINKIAQKAIDSLVEGENWWIDKEKEIE